MNCPDPEVLSAYADKETEAAESRRVERHLGECRVCGRKLEAMRASRTALRALAVPAMPADLARRLGALGRGAASSAPFGGGVLRHLRAALTARGPVVAFALAACVALVLWVRQAGLLMPRLEVPADLLMAAHNQYTLTMPLAPSEDILSEMPLRLAGGLSEERDVY